MRVFLLVGMKRIILDIVDLGVVVVIERAIVSDDVVRWRCSL